MKYAVSGKHGFIGKHLDDTLYKAGHEVLRINQELLYSPVLLKNFFEGEKPEWIIHLAAYGNHGNQNDIAMTVFSNILGTFNMLKESMDVPYKGFIYVSSSSVLLPHETIYSASKAGAERLCKAFVDEFDKPIVIIRPYSVYGTGEAEFRFIPTILRSCEEHEPMPLSPNAVHDWIYVDDFVAGLLLTAEKTNALKGKAIGLGTGKQTTNKEVVEIVEKITGKKANITQEKQLRSFDTDTWMADTTITDALGWKAKISLEEGIKRIYETIK